MQVNIRTALGLVKARLNRLASDATLDTYFVQRIEAAEAELESTGISLTDSADDGFDDSDVTVESGKKGFKLPAIFDNPKVKWAAIALLAAFVLWLIFSGVLWAIIKFVVKLIIGLILLAVVIYIVYEWIL